MPDDVCRRVVVTRRGGPDVLAVAEDPMPQPGPGQIRIQTIAAGVSAFDLSSRTLRLPGFPKPPFTPGVDVIGVVDGLGEGVERAVPGEMVGALLGQNGGYADYVVVAEDTAVPVPPGLDPAEAVCLVANYLTAHAMLHRGAAVREGERILVHGAAGGVGTAILDLGRLAGLEMFGTASPHNHGLVASMRATPIDYHTEDFVSRARELSDGGVDAVFDPIGGWRQLWRSAAALRKGGRLVWFGVADTKNKGARVIPLSLAARFFIDVLPNGKRAPMPPSADRPNDVYRENLAWLFDRLAAGDLAPVIAERMPLEKAALAHDLLEAGGYAGKVVLLTDRP